MIHQQRKHWPFITLGARESTPYAWEELTIARELSLRIGDRTVQVALDKIGFKQNLWGVQGYDIGIEVKGKGLSKVLVLSNNSDTRVAAPVNEEIIQTKIEFVCRKLGISLVDETPRELVYLYAQNTTAILSHSNLYQTADLGISALQIDNQTFPTTYDVLMYSLPNERFVLI